MLVERRTADFTEDESGAESPTREHAPSHGCFADADQVFEGAGRVVVKQGILGGAIEAGHKLLRHVGGMTSGAWKARWNP